MLVLAGRHPVSDDRLMLNKFLKQLIEEITWGFLAFDIDTVMNTHTMHCWQLFLIARTYWVLSHLGTLLNGYFYQVFLF